MADRKPWCKFWFDELSDPELSEMENSEKWCWTALRSYTRMHGERGTVTIGPKNTFLACAFKCNLSDVITIVTRLPKLSVTNTVTGDGSITISFHNWHKTQGDDSAERVRNHRAQKRAKCNASEKEVEQNRVEQKKKHKTPKPPTGDFEKFWAAYPNRKSKQPAERAWAKLAPSPELEATILNALGAQIADRERRLKAGLFVPEWKNPATWLNAKAWLDEVTRDADVQRPANAGGLRGFSAQSPAKTGSGPERYAADLNRAKQLGLE